MKRFVVGGAMCALLGTLSTGVASGARPAEPGCLGASVSAAATADGRGFGAFVSFTARNDPGNGVGDAVQAVLAGVVPDEAFPNTCND